MKKCLSVLVIILLCMFLFVSCDELGQILGDLAGELLSGDTESTDFSTGGGGSVEKLSGTWVGNTMELSTDFSLVECAVTIVMDGEGNFSLSEVDASDSQIAQMEGKYSLDEMLLVVDKANPQTKVVRQPYLFIKTGDTKYFIYADEKAESLAELAELEDDNGEKLDVSKMFSEYVVDGNKLSMHSEMNLLGLSVTDIEYEFDSLETPTTFTKHEKRAEVSDDITTQIKERIITADVVIDEAPEGVDMLLHYEEKTCTSDIESMWYSYDSETDVFTLFWRGETVTLTRQ